MTDARRIALVAAVALGILGASAAPALAAEEVDLGAYQMFSGFHAGISRTALAAEEVDLGAYEAPLRADAADGAALVLGHDDHEIGRYGERLEVRLGSRDLVVVNDVSMSTYVEGLAEVPTSWPAEALKAQAVAARTYAWWSIRRAAFDGYDICATVACQVFHGRSVVEGPDGDRWAAAVAATEEMALTFDGAPILARYFSTSGGATRSNEHVFPSDGAYPYLKGVDDPEDAVSPLHRWRVAFTREEIDAVFAEGRRLRQVVPLASAELIPAGGGQTDRLRLTSAEGTSVVLRASDFRAFVSGTAAELFPDRFPSERPDGRRLPLTLPSSRFGLTVTPDEVVVDGRGYGHGVGMSQYGAKGKADAGWSFDEILAAYYGGIQPAPSDVPERVRVGVRTDLETVRLRSEEPFTVRAGAELITDRALGTWTVRRAADRTMRLVAPPGYGAPLVVSPTTASAGAPYEIQTIQLETVVNKPAEVFLHVTDAGGEVVLRQRVGVLDPGRHRTTWDLDGPDGQLAPGVYDAALRAVDETGEEAGPSVPVEIRAVTPGEVQASLLGAAPVPDRGPPPPPA
ncbi:MAG: SpoIID/LytB domain-containing protein, partial [Nitriliruptorales bacterium]